MIKYLTLATGFLISALVTHLFIVFYVPTLIMYGVLGFTEGEVGKHALFHSLAPNHETDRVVRSSPDLLYSVCSYDLSEGDVRISVPFKDNYVSVALYQVSTDNFITVNDKHVQGDAIELLLSSHSNHDKLDGIKLLTPTEERGLALIRYYLGDKQVETINAIRGQAGCSLV